VAKALITTAAPCWTLSARNKHRVNQPTDGKTPTQQQTFIYEENQYLHRRLNTQNMQKNSTLQYEIPATIEKHSGSSNYKTM